MFVCVFTCMYVCDYRTSVLTQGFDFDISSLSSLNITITSPGETFLYIIIVSVFHIMCFFFSVQLAKHCGVYESTESRYN